MHRSLIKYHPTIGYTFVPNLRARVMHENGGYLIKTNSSGFRSNLEFATNSKAQRSRVLLFGDSYTAGDGVSNEQRFSDQLPLLSDKLEVYNFGLPGSGTDQQYLIYKEFTRNIKHDLVVIVTQVENIRRIVAQYRSYKNDREELICYQKPYFDFSDKSGPTLKNVPVMKKGFQFDQLDVKDKSMVEMGGKFYRLRSIVNELGMKDLVQRFSKYQLLPEYNSPHHPGWKLMEAILEMWIKEIDKPILLVPLPLHHYIEELSNPKHYQKRFKELASRLDVPLHDPLPDLQRYSKEERRQFRFQKDNHPSPLGHKAIAQSLIKPIQDLLPDMTA